MVADKKQSADEITDQPIHGNGDSAERAAADAGKGYRTEEFVRVRQQLTDRLDRVKEELARVDAEDVGRRAADWVKQNPLLAASLAAGVGILLGRGLMSLLSKPEPPSLAERTRAGARRVGHRVQHVAGGVGEAVADHAADAGDYLMRRAGEARADVSRKASEFSDEIGRRAAEMADVISDTASRAADSTRASALDSAEYVRDRADRGRDTLESFLGSIRTAAADVVVGKIRDWLRRS